MEKGLLPWQSNGSSMAVAAARPSADTAKRIRDDDAEVLGGPIRRLRPESADVLHERGACPHRILGFLFRRLRARMRIVVSPVR